MNKIKLKKLLSFKYDILIIPKDVNSGLKTYKVPAVKAFTGLFILLVVSNILFLLLESFTPIGNLLSDLLHTSKEDRQQITELKEKVIKLSEEVKRVQRINERLNLIIEGKPIPVDPRDLDTNYQLKKMRRDSIRILGNSKLKNNLYYILSKIYTRILNTDNQSKDSSTPNQKEFIFFIKPADGLIARGFNKEIAHYGIDFSMPIGSIVKASSSGIIIFADYTINDGYKIIISHKNGYFTVYKHLSQLMKRERDVVKQGDIIARSGNTGKLTTGPHLHFEIWKHQTPLDPKKILVDLNEK